MSETLDNFNNKDDSVKIKKMVLAALFAALIAVGAYIKIPIGPIPITLQTFFVLLAAVTLGRNWGTVSVIVYLLVGFIGFPVFAGGNSGLGILFGPSGGYLYSFIIVAFLCGWLSDIFWKKARSKSAENISKKSANDSIIMFGIAVLGSIIILGVGTVHFAFSGSIPIGTAFLSGFVPFFAGDMIKSIAIGVVSPSIIKKVNFKNF
ncbi:biotin transporter BioY [Methanimicrococcus hongohii]|nr:biotin transporter BioY [Methanimicrococcus sp. Hf6]